MCLPYSCDWLLFLGVAVRHLQGELGSTVISSGLPPFNACLYALAV